MRSTNTRRRLNDDLVLNRKLPAHHRLSNESNSSASAKSAANVATGAPPSSSQTGVPPSTSQEMHRSYVETEYTGREDDGWASGNCSTSSATVTSAQPAQATEPPEATQAPQTPLQPSQPEGQKPQTPPNQTDVALAPSSQPPQPSQRSSTPQSVQAISRPQLPPASLQPPPRPTTPTPRPHVKVSPGGARALPPPRQFPYINYINRRGRVWASGSKKGAPRAKWRGERTPSATPDIRDFQDHWTG